MAGTRDIEARAGLEPGKLDEVVNAILERLLRGETVQIRGFGTFRLVETSARKVEHGVFADRPANRPAGVSVRFKASKTLRANLRRQR